MNLFDEIKKLNFSIGEYVVVGGAAMMAHGLKETSDIDIVVIPDLFERCKQRGWEGHVRPNGEPGLAKNIYEIYLDVNCGNFNPTFSELNDRAEHIEGIPFCNLKDVLRFKREYNREKDRKDIELIERYLQT